MFEEFHSDAKALKEDELKITCTFWRMHYALRDRVLNCFYVLRVSTTNWAPISKKLEKSRLKTTWTEFKCTHFQNSWPRLRTIYSTRYTQQYGIDIAINHRNKSNGCSPVVLWMLCPPFQENIGKRNQERDIGFFPLYHRWGVGFWWNPKSSAAKEKCLAVSFKRRLGFTSHVGGVVNLRFMFCFTKSHKQRHEIFN